MNVTQDLRTRAIHSWYRLAPKEQGYYPVEGAPEEPIIPATLEEVNRDIVEAEEEVKKAEAEEEHENEKEIEDELAELEHEAMATSTNACSSNKTLSKTSQ